MARMLLPFLLSIVLIAPAHSEGSDDYVRQRFVTAIEKNKRFYISKDPVANISLQGHRFDVPRIYLATDLATKDGNWSGLMLDFYTEQLKSKYDLYLTDYEKLTRSEHITVLLVKRQTPSVQCGGVGCDPYTLNSVTSIAYLSTLCEIQPVGSTPSGLNKFAGFDERKHPSYEAVYKKGNFCDPGPAAICNGILKGHGKCTISFPYKRELDLQIHFSHDKAASSLTVLDNVLARFCEFDQSPRCHPNRAQSRAIP